jgi:N-glycosylase/DNA lyase
VIRLKSAISVTAPACERRFPAIEYDLVATLSSGQAFRWRATDAGWEGVISQRWVRLAPEPEGIRAETALAVADWSWLEEYLQVGRSLAEVLASFPSDEPLRQAVSTCRGLRLLRQDPWECLASFILSSTKQIIQIQQIISRMCERFGEPLTVPVGLAPAYSFPGPDQLAAVSEPELRACGMGFRAPYLLETSRAVTRGEIDLGRLAALSLEEARAELVQLPGVGGKIADCVLLFAAGHDRAFPVDVWVLKTLRELYFGGRPVARREVERFAGTHFGACAGYAQQYLFHSARMKAGRVTS